MKTNVITVLLVLTCQICFGLKPYSDYQITPDSLGLTYQKNRIITNDHAELNSWFITADEKNRNGSTLILCYGDMGNMSFWLDQAGILSQVGYDVLMFDYRGFGKSSEFKIDPHYLYYDEFADDLTTVIKWAKHNLKYDKLGLISFSMGTIMSTIALQRESVDFLIGEGFVFSPMNIQSKMKALKGKNILLPESSGNYNQMINQLRLPILLFSGTQDRITTQNDSEKAILNSINGRLITFEGDHLGGFSSLSGTFYGEQYLENISDFLKTIK
jgi:uncharacterized protein